MRLKFWKALLGFGQLLIVWSSLIIWLLDALFGRLVSLKMFFHISQWIRYFLIKLSYRKSVILLKIFKFKLVRFIWITSMFISYVFVFWMIFWMLLHIFIVHYKVFLNSIGILIWILLRIFKIWKNMFNTFWNL